MTYRQTFTLLSLSIVSTAAATAQKPSDLKIKVNANVQVSVARAKENHGEVLVAADPSNPNRLIGCSMIFPDSLSRRMSDGITYFTEDGGAHWKPTLYVDTGLMGTGDPACGYGADGKAFSVYLQPAVKSEMDDVLVYRSNDGGKSWEQPSHVDWIDREYITVDTTPGKYHGHVYINGTGSAGVMDVPLSELSSSPEEISTVQIGVSFQRSLDGGATFRPPLKLFSVPPRWVLGMGNGVVLSDGTYLAVFGEMRDRSKIMDKPPYSAPNAMLKFISSSDGGETYSKGSVISDWYMNYSDIGSTSSVIPVVAVDRSNGPFRDRLYVVWPDYRSGRGEIYLSYSKDKGKTWSKPHAVNDDRPWRSPAKGPDNGMPTVDVNREGIVGVAWYDRRDSPQNYGWSVRFAASVDGGDTFSPSVAVSNKPAAIKFQDQVTLSGFSYGGGKPESREKGGNLDVSIGFGSVFTFNGGHTAGMAADAAGRFHPFWVDNRTGVEQIWTATVEVEGLAIPNGANDIRNLEDVSDKVTLDFKDSNYDKATGVITIDAYLGNTSEVQLRPPLLLRVLTLSSKLGKPTIENATNQQPGPGAVWDFTDELKQKSGLAPGEITKPKRLTFRLSDVQWQQELPSADDLRSFVSFQAKALAPKPPQTEKKVNPETAVSAVRSDNPSHQD